MKSAFNPNKIKERRKALGKSQEWLAGMAGVSPVTISNIEQGRKDPRALTIARIASALELGIESLFTEPEISRAKVRSGKG